MSEFFNWIIMGLYYDLKVFQYLYRLILHVFEFTRDFIREYNFTHKQYMRMDVIKNGIRAAALNNTKPSPGKPLVLIESHHIRAGLREEEIKCIIKILNRLPEIKLTKCS